jgi:hypothetical protein
VVFVTSNDGSCLLTTALGFMPRLTVTFVLTFRWTSGIHRLVRMEVIGCNITKELYELQTLFSRIWEEEVCHIQVLRHLGQTPD